MKIKNPIIEKKGKIYLETHVGKILIKDMLGLSDSDYSCIQDILEKHPEYVNIVGSQLSNFLHLEAVYKHKTDIAKREADYVFNTICHNVRVGKIEIDAKTTESAIKERASISKKYRKALSEYDKAYVEYLDIQRIKNLLYYLYKALKHKKDCLITYDTNWRMEMENDFTGLKKKVKEAQ